MPTTTSGPVCVVKNKRAQLIFKRSFERREIDIRYGIRGKLEDKTSSLKAQICDTTSLRGSIKCLNP